MIFSRRCANIRILRVLVTGIRVVSRQWEFIAEIPFLLVLHLLSLEFLSSVAIELLFYPWNLLLFIPSRFFLFLFTVIPLAHFSKSRYFVAISFCVLVFTVVIESIHTRTVCPVDRRIMQQLSMTPSQNLVYRKPRSGPWSTWKRKSEGKWTPVFSCKSEVRKSHPSSIQLRGSFPPELTFLNFFIHTVVNPNIVRSINHRFAVSNVPTSINTGWFVSIEQS